MFDFYTLLRHHSLHHFCCCVFASPFSHAWSCAFDRAGCEGHPAANPSLDYKPHHDHTKMGHQMGHSKHTASLCKTGIHARSEIVSEGSTPGWGPPKHGVLVAACMPVRPTTPHMRSSAETLGAEGACVLGCSRHNQNEAMAARVSLVRARHACSSFLARSLPHSHQARLALSPGALAAARQNHGANDNMRRQNILCIGECVMLCCVSAAWDDGSHA